MSKKVPGKKGRDLIEIPREQAIGLAEAGWKNVWIAAHFKCSVDTLTERISPEDLDAARQTGAGNLMRKAYQIAMGGKTVRKNGDGSETVVFLQSSNDMLKFLIERRFGRVKQVIELNPDEERPAHIKTEIDPAIVAQAVVKLESDY